MFRHLRTRLTVLYAGLFALALVLVSLVVYASISANARGVVRGELLASGTVFDRIWALRASQLEGGASLLSRDFGFREAVASRDEATIRSALENLRVRLGIDMAFIVGVDGSITGADRADLKDASRQVLRAVEQDDTPSGVMLVGGAPYQTIAAPILSPTLVGWVVFASRLDAREMQSLERLSAIPLDAVVLGRDGATRAWSAPAGVAGVIHGMAPAKLGRMVDSALAMKTPEPRDVSGAQGDALTLVKPLKSIGGEAPAALLLSYPMARAMAPYSPMLYMIVLTGAAGIALLIYGSWILARGVTRPISALDLAAQRLQRGEDVEVEVKTSDELGRLAGSFNTMAAEIRERERRITHLAMHDAETNLPNRLALDRAVEAMAPRALEAGQQVAVLALGIDRFTHVRGAIGYTLSSALIAELGQAIQRLRPGDPVGHVSNGVIGLAFPVRDLDEARRIASHLQRALEAPVRLGDNTVDVSLTVGLAAWPGLVARPGSLINRASVAIDQARAVHAKLALFDAEAYGDPQAKLGLMSEMLAALRSGDISVALQPKYDLREAEVTGVEALVRWRHPVRGMVAPDEFIPLAEETGHIGALTEHVLATAIAHQAALRDAGHRLSMSVNISGRLIGDDAFADLALQIARKAAGELCFEITETAVISNPETALTNLERFAAAGVRISIDDYGSGLSSLAYLKQMRAHELKIDKAFVIGMEESQKDTLLVRSTVDLAHSLGMKVTAEGVETERAQALLAAMGCDIAQGYFIARPMPIDDLLTFLRGGSASVVALSTAKSSRGQSGHPPRTEAG